MNFNEILDLTPNVFLYSRISHERVKRYLVCYGYDMLLISGLACVVMLSYPARWHVALLDPLICDYFCFWSSSVSHRINISPGRTLDVLMKLWVERTI